MTEAPVRAGRHAQNQSHAHGGHEEHLEFTVGEPRFSKALTSSVKFSSFRSHALY